MVDADLCFLRFKIQGSSTVVLCETLKLFFKKLLSQMIVHSTILSMPITQRMTINWRLARLGQILESLL